MAGEVDGHGEKSDTLPKFVRVVRGLLDYADLPKTRGPCGRGMLFC